jgi:hypothetical protein
MRWYIPAYWGHHQETYRQMSQAKTPGASWAKKRVQFLWMQQHLNWKARCTARHKQIVDITDPQAGTLARQDLQANSIASKKSHENHVFNIFQSITGQFN